MKKMKKNNIRAFKQNNYMVAEIVGTVLLLGLVVTIFSAMYITVVSHPAPTDKTFVNLVGTVEGNNIIIDHRGGQSLSLDTRLIVTIGDSKEEIIISDGNFLDEEAKEDNQWDVGERLVYPFVYNLSHCQAKIMVIDEISNSLMMTGVLDIYPESDVGISVKVDNGSPNVGSEVTFTITVTNYRGDMDSTGIIVQYILPYGLIHESNSSTQGVYDKSTGNWDVGELEVRKSATLTITAKVIGKPIQLAILLDGSISIDKKSWDIMINGLANAIQNPNTFPHDGSVELTVIQFGISNCARVEREPVVVTKDNLNDIINDILKITQGGGDTPMGGAIYLASNRLYNSINFGGFKPENRQIINLVTDGNPNIYDFNKITGKNCCGNKKDHKGNNYEDAKQDTAVARNSLLNTLSMTEGQDEFDVVAVEPKEEGDFLPIDLEWLKNEIAWPQPGYTNWPPEGPGWVHHVLDWKEFVDSINEQFEFLFDNITCNMKIIYTTLHDPNIENNQVSITIKTRESFYI